MSKHNETGIKGEQIAENFLKNNGYIILHRNWCFERKEIDIIALKDAMLIFAEVKTRSSFNFGFPEEAVTRQKQNFMKLAAEAYMEANTHYTEVRFDIISILLQGGYIKEIRHFEDAFY